MSYDATPPISINPGSWQLVLGNLERSHITILSGRNNSGKSYILKSLKKLHGNRFLYVGTSRFNTFNTLGVANPKKDWVREKEQHHISFLQNFDRQNDDTFQFSLQQTITQLNDSQRNRLLSLVDLLLGTKSSVETSNPDNEMSQRYVNVDGFNLSFTSSGYRLIVTILSLLSDTQYNVFLVDEPELGLSPEMQGKLITIFEDKAKLEQYFPHIKAIVFASHSHIFLDRNNKENNFFVERNDYEVKVRQIITKSELNELQFFLLGNRFESLHLPGAILFVEGPTDYYFIKRYLALKFPDSLVSIVLCRGDQMHEKISILRDSLGGSIQQSPYSERVFAILDKTHSSGMVSKLNKLGVKNVIVWKENGIEYQYPVDLVEKCFSESRNQMEIKEDEVVINEVSKTKREVCDFVCDKLTSDSVVSEDMQQELIKPLEEILY